MIENKCVKEQMHSFKRKDMQIYWENYDSMGIKIKCRRCGRVATLTGTWDE